MRAATARVDLLQAVVNTLDAVAAPPAVEPAPHLAMGRAGELAAFFYLRRQGYTVVARDWKSARSPGDIDLIAWDDETLCFVEVKTRATSEIASAEAAVDGHKRQTLRKLAGYYVRNLPDGTPTRFDVVSVYLSGQDGPRADRTAEIQLFRGAFDWMERL